MRVRQWVLIVVLVVCAAGLTGFSSHPDSPLPGKITNYFDGNNVQDLAFDQQGYLWAATTHGVVRWDTKKKTYTRYTEKDGLPSDNVTAIAAARDGSIWVGGYGFIARLKSGKWTEYQIPELIGDDPGSDIPVKDILENKKGEVWFATYGAGAIRIVNNKVTVFLMQDGVASVALISVQEDPSGNMWFNQHDPCCMAEWFDSKNTIDGLFTKPGLSMFNGRNWSIIDIFKGTPYVKVELNSDFYIHDDQVWINPGGMGEISQISHNSVSKYSHGLRIFTTPGGLFIDSKDNLWIIQRNSGVIKFDRKDWTGYSQESGLSSNQINGMTEDKKGTLWFATDKGISSLNGETWDYLEPERTLFNIRFDSIEKLIFDEKGKVWIKADTTYITQTYNGLTVDKSSDGPYVFREYNKIKNQRHHQMLDKRVDLVANSADGYKVLAKYHTGNLKCNGNASCGKNSEVDFTITQNKNGLSTITLPKLFLEERIFIDAILLTKDETLWVGTTKGLFVYENSNWNYLSKDDGLPGNIVYSANEAPNGAIWFVTDGGISKYF